MAPEKHMTVISEEIAYDARSDWYVKYITKDKEGEIVIIQHYMHYYYGKTNIPKVIKLRKENRK